MVELHYLLPQEKKGVTINGSSTDSLVKDCHVNMQSFVYIPFVKL